MSSPGSRDATLVITAFFWNLPKATWLSLKPPKPAYFLGGSRWVRQCSMYPGLRRCSKQASRADRRALSVSRPVILGRSVKAQQRSRVTFPCSSCGRTTENSGGEAGDRHHSGWQIPFKISSLRKYLLRIIVNVYGDTFYLKLLSPNVTGFLG